MAWRVAGSAVRGHEVRIMRQPRSSFPSVLVGSVAFLGLVLAACGGGGTSVSSKPTTTTASTETASAPQCHTAQLRASFSTIGAGAGNRNGRVILTNTAPSSCSTIGYVGLQLLGPGGQTIPTTVVRDGPGTPATVVLAPGAQASGTIHWGAIAGGNEPLNAPCEATPQQVQITPPNETQPLTTGWSFGPVCEQGKIDAGPLQAGVPST
jgi:hypothetical protein